MDNMAKKGDLCGDNPSLVSSEIPRSNAVEATGEATVEAMIIKGDAISILVAPGRLGLTVTTAASPGGPSRGARIDSISPDCPFLDEVSVGDIIITINDKEVITSADFSVGVTRTRRLGIIRGANANDREMRIQKEMGLCNSLKVKELKDEMEVGYGKFTTEIVLALAELRADRVTSTTTNKTTKGTVTCSSSFITSITSSSSSSSFSTGSKDDKAQILEHALDARIDTRQSTTTKRISPRQKRKWLDDERSKKGRVGEEGGHIGKEGATANENSDADIVDISDNINNVGRKPSPRKIFTWSGAIRDPTDHGIEGGEISRFRGISRIRKSKETTGSAIDDIIDDVGQKPSPKKKKKKKKTHTNPDDARSGVVRDQIDNGIEGGGISRFRRIRNSKETKGNNMNPTQKDNTTTTSTATSRVVSLSPSASRDDDLPRDRGPIEITEEKRKKGNSKSKADNDEEVVFHVKIQAQQEVIELLDDDENGCVPGGHIMNVTQPIHARYDCIANPFASTVPTLHCPTCWCARCEIPVGQCTDWAGHCTTTVVECQTRNKAARVATLQEQIDAIIISPPPVVDSAIAKLMIDHRWLQLRHTALLWLRNCGADNPASAEDGILTALVYGCEVSTDVARQVLMALQLTNEVVVLGRGLHLRPDTPISDNQPSPFGPHGPQMHEWLAKADAQESIMKSCVILPLSSTHESMKASNIRFQQSDQSNAWRAYFAQAQACVIARGDGMAWQMFYNRQLMARLAAVPEFHRDLERAWHCYFVELAQTRTPKASN